MLSAKQQTRLKAAVDRHLAEDFAGAARIYEELRVGAPYDFQVNHLFGALRQQEGRSTEALALLDRASRSAPGSAATHMCRGLALSALGRHAEAEQAIGQALTLAPLDIEAWSNLGAVYAVSGRTAEAMASFRRAIALKPDYAQAWIGLGSVLHAAGRCAEALECQDRALALDPGSTKVRFARAQALLALHRTDEALADFDAHLALRPQHHQARSFRLFLLNYRDDLTREALAAEHRAYGERVEAGLADRPRVAARRLGPGQPLRVAVLSPDLRMHSVTYFLEPLLQHLDRRAFEIILYHDHHTVDAASERLRASATVWRHFAGWSDEAVERAIRADAPDVLIDLAGHTGHNRLELFARRLAPLQVSYLGYPGTTGLKAMDYRLTDGLADPLGETDHLYTEKLLRFAPTLWAYAPPGEAPEPALPPGLRGGPVAFGSFNNAAKASPATLELWRRLLAALPEARLVLKSSGMEPDSCRQRLAAAGLPVERIDLLTVIPELRDHLAAYARIDVALDSFPYHGTTTTCEALWMGVPVVTLAGDRHGSRVGVSLLTAVGHPEWIAATESAYIEIAVALARDAVRRQELRGALRGQMRASVLLDHAGQARRFGTALQDCWRELAEAADCPHAAAVAAQS